MPRIKYRRDITPDLDAAIALYRASTLGARRPIDDRERMATMLTHANLIVTAWDMQTLVGIARSLTDWSYATYLSDLAVHVDYQRQGIGRELVRHTQNAAPQATLILLSAPAATGYYPRIGMTQHSSAWMLRPGEELR